MLLFFSRQRSEILEKIIFVSFLRIASILGLLFSMLRVAALAPWWPKIGLKSSTFILFTFATSDTTNMPNLNLSKYPIT